MCADNIEKSQKKGDEKTPESGESKSLDFIRAIVVEDLRTKKNGDRVMTRFPPEPNGYLHIGHAKSICLNFGIAQEFKGVCNLRFDDTNPSKEDVEYVQSIQRDVRWLGFDWENRLYYASDYFDKMYEYAIQLIKEGKAYMCSMTAEEVREYRGTLTEGGKESPDSSRSIEENLALFERMRAGEFEEGQYVLRARIDMSSPNINMRDPIIYRILKLPHQRTGDKWCIYPMYDYAHCISDSIEGITHSICTLEFENHRPLYDWFLDELKVSCHPQQIEFARLNLTYTVMSKRKLLHLVKEHHVAGWDDPRMPTIAGMRRRGYTPQAIRNFCERIGVGKTESTIDFALLEYCVREDLNKCAQRVMGVIRPLKAVIENYPEGKVEELDAFYQPEDPAMGMRKVPFSRVLYIERDDFMENPPKEFYRLAPGREVRLRYGYFIKCTNVIKDKKTGEVIELRCTYDPKTKGGDAPDGRKVKSTLHWVSATQALEAEARLYENLFIKADPEENGENFLNNLNPKSLEVVKCYVEPSLKTCKVGDHYQFERIGYFSVDLDTTKSKLVFNRTATLRDEWAKIQKSQPGSSAKASGKK